MGFHATRSNEFDSLCQHYPYAVSANGIKIYPINSAARYYIIKTFSVTLSVRAIQ
jgi:hypothetical protein